MAYGNWGAWVYRNGERMRDWEDQTPYHETEVTAGYWQAFGYNIVENGVHVACHHAVLGEGRIRLCGYKCVAVLFLDGIKVDLQPYQLLRDDDPEQDCAYNDPIAGEIDGYRFRAEPFNGNMIDLRLEEPDGTIWTARCGYCYGRGWMADASAVDCCDIGPLAKIADTLDPIL